MSSDNGAGDRDTRLAWPPFIVKIGVQRVGTHYLYRPRPIRTPAANHNADDQSGALARTVKSANENVG